MLFTDVFDDVTKRGKKIPTSEYLESGKYPIIDQGQSDIAGYTNEENGLLTDVPVIIFGDHTRAVKYVDTPFFLGADGVKVLKSKINDVNYKYLYYAISSVNIPDTGYNRHFKWLKEADIQIPSIKRQSEIVEILDNLTNLIDLHNQQLSKLDELVKSRFIELFGDAENKIPISEMCNVTGGYSFKSGDISNDGAIRILQIGNVYLDNVSWETTNYLPEGYDEKYSKFLLNKDDIVIALTRPIIQSLGNVKVCIVKSSDLPCLLNQRVGRISAKNKEKVFLEYIYGCLMTDDFSRYVESCSIGCSQPNISTKDIENYLIPNATYEKQKVYVDFKKQVDKSKFEVQQSLEKLETLKKSLMQQYFGWGEKYEYTIYI